jgi:hypothetical protein
MANSPWPKRLVWLAATAVLLLVVISTAAAIRRWRAPAAARPLNGYDSNAETFRSQYHDFYGKLMSDPNAERLFEQAATAVAVRQFAEAAGDLLEASKEAPLPVVFIDLGIVLGEMQDRAGAAAAFREAISRLPDDPILLQNLARLGGVDVEASRPVAEEAEPNNSLSDANVIALQTDVPAAIPEGTADVDCFRFVTPPGPRDHIAIEIENRSPTLELGMRLYDGSQRLAMDHRAEGPGKRILEYIAPRPNTTWYLEIWSAHDSGGGYTVRVSPLRAFDDYEPNDNIFAATHIQPGTTIRANIMDVADTDFYSFESQATGTVTIELENRSETLIPALSTFGPDKRNTGFGPDVRTPGGSLRHTMAVEAYRTYYLQVWSQSRTIGEYSLTIH